MHPFQVSSSTFGSFGSSDSALTQLWLKISAPVFGVSNVQIASLLKLKLSNNLLCMSIACQVQPRFDVQGIVANTLPVHGKSQRMHFLQYSCSVLTKIVHIFSTSRPLKPR